MVVKEKSWAAEVTAQRFRCTLLVPGETELGVRDVGQGQVF